MVVVNTVCVEGQSQSEVGSQSLVCQNQHINESVTQTGGHFEKPVIRHSVQFITSTEIQHFTEIHNNSLPDKKIFHFLKDIILLVLKSLQRFFWTSAGAQADHGVDVKEAKQIIQRTSCYLYTGCTAYGQKVSYTTYVHIHIYSAEAKYIKPFKAYLDLLEVNLLPFCLCTVNVRTKHSCKHTQYSRLIITVRICYLETTATQLALVTHQQKLLCS